MIMIKVFLVKFGVLHEYISRSSNPGKTCLSPGYGHGVGYAGHGYGHDGHGYGQGVADYLGNSNVRVPVACLVFQNRNLEYEPSYGKRRCGFNSKQQSTGV